MAISRTAVQWHVELLNAGVRRREFSDFVATFADDAVVRFEGVSVGPYVGRRAIAMAYSSKPPDDTMTVTSIADGPDGTTLVRFDWCRGGGGFFLLGMRGGLVVRLDVSFLREADSAWIPD